MTEAAPTVRHGRHWVPTSTLEERIKHAVVPARLYHFYRAKKEWLRGEAEVRLLPFLVDPARNSVDVGANKGVYTWYLGRLSRTVYAFEPNPKMYRLLKRVAGDNIVASAAALADRTGHAVFRLPRKKRGYTNQGGTLRDMNLGPAYDEVEVECRRLDDCGIADVGFMKIDVEGFEQQVLDGARATIERDRPAMLIELEERHTNRPIEQSLESVLGLGYRGLFLQRGRLRPIEAFDPETHHRAPPDRKGYVYNFVFLPER